LVITDVPSDAARRAARGSSYDGTCPTAWRPFQDRASIHGYLRRGDI